MNTGSSALADPEVTADESTAGALTLSWESVENAGSYIISFGTKEPDAEYAEDEYIIDNVTATSYTWKNFPSGTYTVNVQAVPAEPEKFTNSLIIGTTVTVTAPALTNMSSGSLTQDDFSFLAAVVGTGKLAKGNVITYKNFMFTENKGDKVNFNKDSNFGYYYNTGGSSSPKADAAEASQTIRFLAAGNGKLEVIAASTGNKGEVRKVGYAINGEKTALSNQLPDKPSAAITEPNALFDVTAVAGDAIDVYGDANIYIMSLTWTPAATGEGIPFDENAINEAYVSDFSNAEVFPACSLEVNTVIQKVTYAASSSKKIYFDGSRCKFLGAPGGFDDNGLPTDRYASFGITKPGTVHYKLIASNTSNTDTNVSVALVLTKGEQKEVILLDNSIADLSSSAETRTKEVTAAQLAGSTDTAYIYVFSNNKNTNLYEIGFTPAE